MTPGTGEDPTAATWTRPLEFEILRRRSVLVRPNDPGRYELVFVRSCVQSWEGFSRMATCPAGGKLVVCPHELARNLQMSSTFSVTEFVTLGAAVALRDGSRVLVRQLHRSDGKLLLRGFERLSAEARFQRFLTPMPGLTAGMVRYLTEIDHHDHEAIIALDEATGEGVGVGRYVRDRECPDVAEVAVTVIDEWQGRGLGALLLDLIGARARDEGIMTFKALILATNEEMIDLLRRLAPPRIVDRETGRVEIEVPIPGVGVAPALRKLFRVASRGDLDVSSGWLGAGSADRARERGGEYRRRTPHRAGGFVPMRRCERRTRMGTDRAQRQA